MLCFTTSRSPARKCRYSCQASSQQQHRRRLWILFHLRQWAAKSLRTKLWPAVRLHTKPEMLELTILEPAEVQTVVALELFTKPAELCDVEVLE